MDAGTIVALVLGTVGPVWGAGTSAINRRDANERDECDQAIDREKRWLQEKRLIYVRAQAALDDELAALSDHVIHDPSETGHAQRASALHAAQQEFREARAAVDMRPPKSCDMR
ncbi:hypothetical protein [Cellulomonas sp. ICMP 17802]|uniref:hypothetical protein n=1 Tax=Cellulomonas sp. ICMP 17802 TaxID=3239199 RepID=UPI00351B650A